MKFIFHLIFFSFTFLTFLKKYRQEMRLLMTDGESRYFYYKNQAYLFIFQHKQPLDDYIDSVNHLHEFDVPYHVRFAIDKGNYVFIFMDFFSTSVSVH